MLDNFVVRGGRALRKARPVMTGLFLPFLCIALLLVFAAAPPEHATLLIGLAGITAVATDKKNGTDPKKSANIRKMEADLKALARELEAGQVEMEAGPITAERGEELESKAQEMEALQAHIDQYNKIAGITRAARQVEKVTLPSDGERRTKSVTTTPGHIFVASDAYRNYKREKPQSCLSAQVDVGRRLGRKVRLTGEAATVFESKAFSEGQLSDLGEDAIIATDRDPEIVRFEEPEILTIRDALNVVTTTSDAIKYVRHTATVRAADLQASRGAAKSYLTIVFEPKTVSVETVAVLAKVTEQDISDAPRLVGIINGEMTLDVKVKEEQHLLWDADGLFDPAVLVPEFDRAEVNDTVIDTIRRMRTDLRKKRVMPSFVMVDPLDWEAIETAKGSDYRYIWGLITDVRGPRIWSLRVIESDAMTREETGERRILVGDGVRGATIYDRENIALAVGFVNDDFERNLRTLRAESRLAMAVKRPYAFEFAVTAEGES